MELRIDRNRLLNSLSHIQQVAERKNTVEILRNVLLECRDGTLCATATDIDTTLCETLECYVDKAGEKTVSAFMLYDIVRKLPDGAEILLKEEGNALQLTVGTSLFRLAALPKAEFPAVDQFDVIGKCSIAAADMHRLIENTLFAAATTSEVRYYLNGVFLHYHRTKQQLRTVATNSHRLARHDVVAGDEMDFLAEGVILPRKAVAELRRLLEGVEEPITLELGEANVRFTVGSVVLTCKLIAGKYPDYERVIPELEGEPLILEAEGFFDSVARVSAISNASQNNGIRVTLGAGSIKLEATDQDKNTGQAELKLEHHLSPFEVGFNASYLQDIGQHISGERVQFWYPRSNGPVLMLDPDNPSSLFVLMPMRV